MMPPVSDNACKMPTEAAEDWITPVNTAPTITPRKGLVKAVRMAENSGMSARGLTAFFISSIPVMSTANPTMMEPALRTRFFLEAMVMTTPASATTGEKTSGFSSCSQMASLSIPDRERIQAVRVVPTLDPMMTPTVCPSSMMPEFTRPTSITVTAEEDWMAMVIPAPSRRLLKQLSVIFFRSCSSRPPASFSKPEDIVDMPKRKNASPPHSVIMEKISMRCSLSLFSYSNIHSDNNSPVGANIVRPLLPEAAGYCVGAQCAPLRVLRILRIAIDCPDFPRILPFYHRETSLRKGKKNITENFR